MVSETLPTLSLQIVELVREHERIIWIERQPSLRHQCQPRQQLQHYIAEQERSLHSCANMPCAVSIPSSR